MAPVKVGLAPSDEKLQSEVGPENVTWGLLVGPIMKLISVKKDKNETDQSQECTYLYEVH